MVLRQPTKVMSNHTFMRSELVEGEHESDGGKGLASDGHDVTTAPVNNTAHAMTKQTTRNDSYFVFTLSHPHLLLDLSDHGITPYPEETRDSNTISRPWHQRSSSEVTGLR